MLTLSIHKRQGQGEPDRHHCEVLAKAGYIGPCWADMYTGEAAGRFRTLVQTPDPTEYGPLFEALELLYYQDVEQECRR
jgi:hypothetical protein